MSLPFPRLRRYLGLYRVNVKTLGYRPNLLRPRSFNEKVLRMKLRRPPREWSRLTDKVIAKDIAAARAGREHIIPTLALFTAAGAVSLDGLPEQFIIKANHGSGWAIIIRDKRTADVVQIRATCADWLRTRYGRLSDERWYDAIPPTILIEPLVTNRDGSLPIDYKCWVFHGRVAFIQVDFDRFTHHTRTFYDREWREQPWTLVYPKGPGIERPHCLNALIDLAERLSGSMPFIRIDLYHPDDGRLLFGEFSLVPEAGTGRFEPVEMDFEIGRLW